VTSPRPEGVVGGPIAVALADRIAGALRESGDDALPDGALAAAATHYVRETARGRRPGTAECEAIARRLGFAGVVFEVVGFSHDNPRGEMVWRRALARGPRNVPVTRYGLHASPSSEVAALVLGSVEATLEPFPRRVALGQSLRLRGEVAPRFDHARVYVTSPDGRVWDRRSSGRRIDTAVELSQAGKYQVEVTGNGDTGPFVVVNVPVYVGDAAESQTTPPVGTGARRATPEEAEARMMSLLAAARAKAGLAPVEPDAELRGLALAHAKDMAQAGFVGHVSPTTGTVADRARRAGVKVLQVGENIAQAPTVDAAHDNLMDSPAHRAVMLNDKFTHVGIAVVDGSTGRNVLATLVFGRRPTGAVAWTATHALEAIAALRKASAIPAAPVDRDLTAAAEAGVKAYAANAVRTAAVEEAASQAKAELARRDTSRHREGVCVHLFALEHPEQLDQLPTLVDAKLRRMGVAVTTRVDGDITWLVLLVVAEGGECA
jgi:uncharacterized protein YkwD